MTALEDRLEQQLQRAGFPPPVKEHRFHPTRRWRFDFAYPAIKLAIECEGGTWVRGAHTRGAHFESDCEKYNSAALLGWTVLRFTTDMVLDGRALQVIVDAIERLEKPLR